MLIFPDHNFYFRSFGPKSDSKKPISKHLHLPALQVSDPGSGAFYPWILDEKNSDPRSGINITDHISKSLATIFWVRNIYILCSGSTSVAHPDPYVFGPSGSF
jgi:hypothetical protein